VKSTVDYIVIQQKDKAKVRNVKVISSEECVPKHKLLVMDMWFKASKSWHRKFKPRVSVWKLKEEKTCEEFRCMVRDKAEEAKWKGLCVNDHWQQMKALMMETAQDLCGMTKGPCRHKETWWWNEEVAGAVREKKIKYGKWKKENMEEARTEYKKSRQNAKRVISSAKEKKQNNNNNNNDRLTAFDPGQPG